MENEQVSNTSVYAPSAKQEAIESRTIACIVDNEPGVLARVVGLFSARGYNIESLTVAETDEAKHRSRITIVTDGTPSILEQIVLQLARLVPVRRVGVVTGHPQALEREMALFKVVAEGEKRVEAARLADIFRAKVVDVSNTSFIFELTGTREKIDAFRELMKPLGLTDISRTGVLSINRGPEEGIGDRRRTGD
ncbi:acetolactate synthase small subunit [Parvularcula flava]|uniref:Acetolactate synthase small subunit n=1 Tax=Aquisalinus luteolus TaxID=1566827 RepID=A0ABX0HMF9_9PROT|nr:acetolactate synthase small subunit [Aquisalinus luteolus]